MKLRSRRWWSLKLRRRWSYFRSDPVWYFFEAVWCQFTCDDPEVRRVVARIYIVAPALRVLGFSQDSDDFD